MSANNNLNLSADKKMIAWIVSVLIHVALVLLVILFPTYTREKPPEAYEGVLVSFGLPIESDGEDEANLPPPEKEIEEEEKEEPIDVKESQQEEEVKAEMVEEESEVLIEQKEEDIKPVDRQKSIEEVKEEDPEEQLDKAKDEFSKLFSSKGNNNKSTTKSGDPLGEPDAEMLEGISKGEGKVGGGLDERGILFEPEIIEHSQKSGRVVIKVCVNQTGKVISAKYTQRNSTTTDKDLVDIAEISAMKYRFMPSDFEEQCGTISITFIVR
jgi:outer membrane biosynthesis protein TonB